jgi:hypothetical protein
MPESLHPDVRAALQQGIEVARAEMKKRSEAGVDAAKFFGPRTRIGTSYMDRAMGIYMGIFGNVPQVSVYLSMPTDAAGQALDGSKAVFTLTFAKGQLPPVKYFWLITMHSIPQRLLVENPGKGPGGRPLRFEGPGGRPLRFCICGMNLTEKIQSIRRDDTANHFSRAPSSLGL